jgi:threonine/homoserine/homoserine lactone efflux protein
MWIYFLAGAAYGFAAGAQPGPLNAYLMSITLRHGFRRALPATFAPLISDAFIVALMLFILTRIPFALIRWLHLLGGVFVLYLAWDAWQTFRNFERAEEQARSHAVESLWKAAVINLLNPNPYLGWSLVLGPLVLQGWHSSPRDGVAVGVGFYGALIGTTILIVLLFDFARSSGPRVARALVAISAVALGCFGLYQLWLGAAGAHLDG